MMKTMVWIVEAEVLNDYTLKLVFNDGSKKIFDFRPLIEKQDIYKPLKNNKLLIKIKSL